MVISAAEAEVNPRCRAYLGGTFDPVHYGHLRSALELKHRLQLVQMSLVPCHRPPHREATGASSEQRLVMVKLACAEFPELSVDDRELQRPSLSYTVDTLSELRQQWGSNQPLAWVVGADAFAGLSSWHQWQSITDYAHLIVIARPGESLPERGDVADWVTTRQLDRAQQLHQQASGGIWVEALTPYDLSATMVRQRVSKGKSIADDVPAVVQNYIQQHNLYSGAADKLRERS